MMNEQRERVRGGEEMYRLLDVLEFIALSFIMFLILRKVL